MRRRLLLAILSVTTLAIVLFGVPLALMAARFVDETAAAQLERQAALASRAVPSDFEAGADPIELPIDGISYAVYNRLGRRVHGDGPASADPATVAALNNVVRSLEINEARVVAVPLVVDEVVIGVVRAQQSTAASDARVRRITLALVGIAAFVVLIGAGVGYLLANRLTRPVRRLRDAAVALGEGNFDITVSQSGVPELDQAGDAVTATAHRLNDVIGRERAFSADVSHQLRTPLAGLRAAIETELAFPRADSTEVLHEALSDVTRLEATITELLTMARASASSDSVVSIDHTLSELQAGWHTQLTRAGRSLIVAPCASKLWACGSTSALSHALDVLLDNALGHGDGIVRIGATSTDETVTITITDDGDGLVPGTPDQSGDTLHGFGLPLARRLVASMPGRLVIARSAPKPRLDVVLQRVTPPQH